ncbi:MAG: Trk system potassium transporter TrkA, partial [Bacteroidales bacterium]|nr:Trk system potassium transporter TrkA [Bacteroidales bacterium]
PFRVVAIKRQEKTLIPRGNDMMLAGDLVYFMTTKKQLPVIRSLCGKDNYDEIKNIAIIGGGSVAVEASWLIPDHMNVKIIEKDEERAKQLTGMVHDRVMVIHGDGRDMQLLMDEGILKTQAFVALTGSAETNILACLTAKRLGVRKTVAMVENLDYVGMAESLDIGTILNKKTIAAGHIYQMMVDAAVSNLKCLTVSSADVVELIVGEKSRAASKQIKDLDLPAGAIIGGLVRNGEGILASGATRIESEDSAVVFCVNTEVKKLEKYFK